MAGFVKALEGAGCSSARTVGASGNAVVEASARVTDPQLERMLEMAVSQSAGLVTVAFVRDRPAWQALVEANPFVREAVDDPAHLVVTVLRSHPPPSRWSALKGAIVGRERLAEGDRCAYLVYPDGIGRSKLTAAAIERALGVPGTSRNWNTVRTLLQLVAE